MRDTKHCPKCSLTKSVCDFNTRTSNGKIYLFSYCRECQREYKKRFTHSAEHQKKWATHALAKQKHERLNNVRPEFYILKDSRGSDRKKGFENDLTKEFIKDCITNPCTYCGATNLKMVLDRIDNTIGHVMTNVVPACFRCNHTRGNMPHAAWLYLAEGMRQAREANAFGLWAEEPFSRIRS